MSFPGNSRNGRSVGCADTGGASRWRKGAWLVNRASPSPLAIPQRPINHIFTLGTAVRTMSVEDDAERRLRMEEARDGAKVFLLCVRLPWWARSTGETCRPRPNRRPLIDVTAWMRQKIYGLRVTIVKKYNALCKLPHCVECFEYYRPPFVLVIGARKSSSVSGRNSPDHDPPGFFLGVQMISHASYV